MTMKKTPSAERRRVKAALNREADLLDRSGKPHLARLLDGLLVTAEDDDSDIPALDTEQPEADEADAAQPPAPKAGESLPALPPPPSPRAEIDDMAATVEGFDVSGLRDRFNSLSVPMAALSADIDSGKLQDRKEAIASDVLKAYRDTSAAVDQLYQQIQQNLLAKLKLLADEMGPGLPADAPPLGEDAGVTARAKRQVTASGKVISAKSLRLLDSITEYIRPLKTLTAGPGLHASDVKRAATSASMLSESLMDDYIRATKAGAHASVAAAALAEEHSVTASPARKNVVVTTKTRDLYRQIGDELKIGRDSKAFTQAEKVDRVLGDLLPKFSAALKADREEDLSGPRRVTAASRVWEQRLSSRKPCAECEKPTAWSYQVTDERERAEDHGLWIPLCPDHKGDAQKVFEQNSTVVAAPLPIQASDMTDINEAVDIFCDPDARLLERNDCGSDISAWIRAGKPLPAGAKDRIAEVEKSGLSTMRSYAKILLNLIKKEEEEGSGSTITAAPAPIQADDLLSGETVRIQPAQMVRRVKVEPNLMPASRLKPGDTFTDDDFGILAQVPGGDGKALARVTTAAEVMPGRKRAAARIRKPSDRGEAAQDMAVRILQAPDAEVSVSDSGHRDDGPMVIVKSREYTKKFGNNPAEEVHITLTRGMNWDIKNVLLAVHPYPVWYSRELDHKLHNAALGAVKSATSIFGTPDSWKDLESGHAGGWKRLLAASTDNASKGAPDKTLDSTYFRGEGVAYFVLAQHRLTGEPIYALTDRDGNVQDLFCAAAEPQDGEAQAVTAIGHETIVAGDDESFRPIAAAEIEQMTNEGEAFFDPNATGEEPTAAERLVRTVTKAESKSVRAAAAVWDVDYTGEPALSTRCRDAEAARRLVAAVQSLQGQRLERDGDFVYWTAPPIEDESNDQQIDWQIEQIRLAVAELKRAGYSVREV